MNGKIGEKRMGSQRKLQTRERWDHRLKRRTAGVRWILGCRGMFIAVTSRAVLLRGFIVRVLRTEGFAHAVVDREQEGKRGYGCHTWYQKPVPAKHSKHRSVMLQHHHPRCQSVKTDQPFDGLVRWTHWRVRWVSSAATWGRSASITVV